MARRHNISTPLQLTAPALTPDVAAQAYAHLEATGTDLQNGDIVNIEVLEDPTTGTTEGLGIIVGTEIQPLDYSASEVGNPPPAFTFPNYSPHYWAAALPEAEVIWFNPAPYADLILQEGGSDFVAIPDRREHRNYIYFDRATPEERSAVAQRFRQETAEGHFIALSRFPHYREDVAADSKIAFYPAQ